MNMTKKTGNIEDPFDALGRPVLFLFEKSRYLTLSHGNLSRGIFHKLLVLMWTNGRQPSRAQQTCSNRSARETGMLPPFSQKKKRANTAEELTQTPTSENAQYAGGRDPPNRCHSPRCARMRFPIAAACQDEHNPKLVRKSVTLLPAIQCFFSLFPSLTLASIPSFHLCPSIFLFELFLLFLPN